MTEGGGIGVDEATGAAGAAGGGGVAVGDMAGDI